jgi:hypothetical protein
MFTITNYMTKVDYKNLTNYKKQTEHDSIIVFSNKVGQN